MIRLEAEDAKAKARIGSMMPGAGPEIGEDGSVPGIELPEVGSRIATEHQALMAAAKANR